jgi:hypothetical protein
MVIKYVLQKVTAGMCTAASDEVIFQKIGTKGVTQMYTDYLVKSA